MKNLNKFAAQQLSKNQMNNVKGGNNPDNCGTLFHCTWSNGENYVCEKDPQAGELLNNPKVTCFAI